MSTSVRALKDAIKAIENGGELLYLKYETKLGGRVFITQRRRKRPTAKAARGGKS